MAVTTRVGYFQFPSGLALCVFFLRLSVSEEDPLALSLPVIYHIVARICSTMAMNRIVAAMILDIIVIVCCIVIQLTLSPTMWFGANLLNSSVLQRVK
jgi:hypothetical protein